MRKQKPSLLQDIQNIVGCSFLSDLHNIIFQTKEKKEISEISEDLYSLEEWNKAASYITSNFCDYKTIEEVKNFIIGNP